MKQAGPTAPAAPGRFVRTGWFLAVTVAVGVILAALPGYMKGLPMDAEMSPETSPALIATVEVVGGLASLATALLCLVLAMTLFARKRGDSMALIVSFYLLVYGAVMAGPLEAAFYGWGAPVRVATFAQVPVLGIATVTVFCTFPSGRFAPAWTRWLVIGAVLLNLMVLAIPVEEFFELSTPRVLLTGSLLAGLMIAGIAAQIVRYRRLSSAREKQQTKWVLAGLLLWIGYVFLASIPYVMVNTLPPGEAAPWWLPFTTISWWLSLSILPLSLSAAILRNRLFDLDIIIRKTLVYTVLTAALLLVYFGAVILLQTVFVALTGQDSPISIVISTLLIAALFSPGRRRVQNLVDRRFYRRKYDAAQALLSFSVLARDEVALDELTGEIVRLMSETMQPESVSLWLPEPAGAKGVAGDR